MNLNHLIVINAIVFWVALIGMLLLPSMGLTFWLGVLILNYILSSYLDYNRGRIFWFGIDMLVLGSLASTLMIFLVLHK